ncbi:MAG: NAD(P)-dependent oxidoreductase [Puniceicoccaceae bacterium]|nr:MAG: NAD(P)-dependent oxidoreductase [Puniceicoccaceae bacterium]|tara:strand:- start:538 stop:1500 length:963 start_codon:yes stop_codon:yes gene_type:complete
MKILVTGSSGFIGRWLGNLLDEKNIVWAGMDTRKKCEHHQCKIHYQIDFSNSDQLMKALNEFQPEVVVHLAARCDLKGKTLEDYKVNQNGVKTLCEAIRKTRSIKRSIFTSSQLVCKIGYVPKDEEDFCPPNIYGASKVCTEKIVRCLGGGMKEWCITRPTTVWGPNMGAHYRKFLEFIHKGYYFHSGEGALYKSYSYVQNIAYQYYKLCFADKKSIHQKVFYLADYEPISLREQINGYADLMGVKKPYTIPLIFCYGIAATGDALNFLGVPFPYNSFRLKNIRTEYIYDLSETKKVCGELPFSFEDALNKTSEWFLNSK